MVVERQSRGMARASGETQGCGLPFYAARHFIIVIGSRHYLAIAGFGRADFPCYSRSGAGIRGKSFGSHMAPFADALIGGWQLSSIIRFASGLPLRFTANNALGQYNYKVTRPNIVSSQAIVSKHRTVDAWFNTAAFSTLGTAGIGNVPRFTSTVRRAPTRVADMALEKKFPLFRETNLQLRVEAYNISNTPQYAAPDTNFGDSNFGQINSTNSVGPRTIQLGARFQF